MSGEVRLVVVSLLRLLVDNLIAITPPLPPAEAPCHRGLVSQDKCGRCSRIAAALAAIELGQRFLESEIDAARDVREAKLAKRREARSQRKAAADA